MQMAQMDVIRLARWRELGLKNPTFSFQAKTMINFRKELPCSLYNVTEP